VWLGKVKKGLKENVIFKKSGENDLRFWILQTSAIFLCFQVLKSRQICGFH